MSLSSFEGLVPSVARLLADVSGTVLCAVSGGGDSVSLACTVALYAQSAPITPVLVHVHHGIRGKSADDDAAFVQSLADRLGVRLITYRGDVPGAVSTDGGGVEEAARKIRYGFLKQAMAETNARCVLLAHHEGDLVENVLLHLTRGCGLDGLCGMPEKAPFGDGFLARPFLCLPKERLLHALSDAGISWRTDETNLVPDCARNRVRLQVLPLLEQIRPGAAHSVASSARTLAQDQQYWDGLTADILARSMYFRDGYCILSRKVCAGLHPAVMARVLREAWRISAGPVQESSLSADATLRLAALCEAPEGSMQLPGHVTVLLSPAAIRFTSPTLSPRLPVLTRLPFTGFFGDGRQSQAFPLHVLDGAVLRSRQEGDVIQPFGGGFRKLKDFLQAAHMENVLRTDCPVLAKGREVLWVIGAGPSAQARLHTGEEGVVLFADGSHPGVISTFLSQIQED